MRLLLAVSADGYLAKGPDDNMNWAGPDDKALFRALTSVGGLCCVGRRSAVHMPSHLAGRELKVLSNSVPGHWTLSRAGQARDYSGGRAWLLGGPTLAEIAIRCNALSEIHLCVNEAHVFPGASSAASAGYLLEGMLAVPVAPLLKFMYQAGFRLRMSTGFGKVRHTLYTIMDRAACGGH